MRFKIKMFPFYVFFAAALPAMSASIYGVHPAKVRTFQSHGGVRTFERTGGAAFDNSCTAAPGLMWIDSPTEESRKSMLAVLLTAQATGMTVQIDYIVTNGSCWAQAIYLE